MLSGSASAASAQEADLLLPKLTIDGSLPFTFNSNPAHDPSNTRPGNLFSPYFQVGASGSLRENFGYLFYANTNLDKSLTHLTSDSDDSQAAFGVTLSRRWGDFSLHLTAEHNYFFDDVYKRFDSTANDFSIAARYRYVTADGNFWARPSFITTIRVDDDFDVLRYTYNFKIDFERRIKGPLWFVLTPRLRYYDYEQMSGDAERHDTLASISAGLLYIFNDDVSLTTMLGYEKRVSNQPGKGYDNLMLGTSLDFSFGIDGRDWLFERPPGYAYAQSRP